MKYRVNDTVTLLRDLPEHELREGDVGAVVHVGSDDAVDVEFVSREGRTTALVSLKASDVQRSIARSA